MYLLGLKAVTEPFASVGKKFWLAKKEKASLPFIVTRPTLENCRLNEMCRGGKLGMWVDPEPPSGSVTVRRLRSLSSDSVLLTPSAAGGGALGPAGCLA